MPVTDPACGSFRPDDTWLITGCGTVSAHLKDGPPGQGTIMPLEWLKTLGAILWNGLRTLNTLVLGIISIVLVLGLLSAAMQGPPEVPEGGALLLDPKGALVEQKSAVDPATVLQTGELPEETLVQDVVDALELGAEDDRISVVVLQLDGFGGGLLPKLERIAGALTAFRESGKKVIAVGTFYSQPGLYLASHADEVLMDPEGLALPEGFAMYRTYYRTLLDNFDVNVNLFKVGKYKSAIEPFIRDDMSPEDKEARSGIVDNWWRAYTGAMEAARGLEAGSIDEAINTMPDGLRAVDGNIGLFSQRVGMVDQLMTTDERRAYLEELAGKDEEEGGYRRIAFGDYLAAAREPVEHKDNKIAVITAVGGIVDGDAEAGSIGSVSLTRLIQKAHEDEDVKAIVLRVDSGGGSKSASEVIRQELVFAQDKGLPVIASMGSVAASGGYWISAKADKIYAAPSTVTGSIGILGMFPTYQRTAEYLGVKIDGVGTTPWAGELRPDREMSEHAKRVFQQSINHGYDDFLNHVAEGRDMSVDRVHEVAQGRIWTGLDALNFGLVDELGDLDDAVLAAAEAAGLEAGSYGTVVVQEPLSSTEQMIVDLLGTAKALGVDPGVFVSEPRTLERLARQFEAMVDPVLRFNDPMGRYAHCFCSFE